MRLVNLGMEECPYPSPESDGTIDDDRKHSWHGNLSHGLSGLAGYDCDGPGLGEVIAKVKDEAEKSLEELRSIKDDVRQSFMDLCQGPNSGRKSKTVSKGSILEANTRLDKVCERQANITQQLTEFKTKIDASDQNFGLRSAMEMLDSVSDCQADIKHMLENMSGTRMQALLDSEGMLKEAKSRLGNLS